MIHYTKNIYKAILGAFLCVLGAFCVASCGAIREIPVEYREITNYIDSLVLRDSTVIIPIERVVDIVPVYDTLKLETSMAMSEAYVDTLTHSLKGRIENKQDRITKYMYKDRYIERTDTIKVEIPIEVPVEVRYVPPFYKRCTWGFFILIGLLVAIVLGKLYFSRKI